jgi:hypothetical protein
VAAPRGVRVVATERVGEGPAATVAALERAGYRVHVALLPGTYFVSATGAARALPAGVFEAMPSAAPDRDLDFVPASPLLRGVAGTGHDAAPGALEEHPFGGRADVLEPLRSSSRSTRLSRPFAPVAPLPSGLPYGARWEDTSEFMIGKVAISILFPESDGSTDANRFTWTAALRDSVVRSAVRGLLRWSVFAAARNVPLTFLLEVRANLATRYEPIDRPVSQETLWIEDALEPLVGYRGDVLAMAYEVANGARARLGAQWAGLVFAVQNDTSSVGTFPDGFIAHARLGGPWFVIPVNNLNTRSASLDFYMEHEVTHLFWALDEFPATNAWWSCTLTTGYFDRPNTNADVPSPVWCKSLEEGRRCLMKGNYPDSLCFWTEEQIGWVDLDRSGTLDLYETRPAVAPDSTRYRVGAGQSLTLRGRANEVPLPNKNPYRFYQGDSISIATIDSVEYRFDGGAWTPIPCEDGRFDFGEERFTLVLPPQVPGNHLVEWRAWNSSGRTGLTPSTTTVTISGTSGAIETGAWDASDRAPSLAAWPSPAQGPVRFTLRGAPGARARARVTDVAGRHVRVWSVSVPAAGILAWEWDRRGDGGGVVAAGLYFLTVEIGPNRVTRRVILLK